ncbi:MAG: DUF6134 family protein [Woeseiaceae bacterium]
MKYIVRRIVAACFLLPLIGVQTIFAEPAIIAEPAMDAWNFNVYLDDKKVGTHVFEVVQTGAQKEVQSIADFKVKFLFISAYSYEHSNIERWSDDCLLTFNAKTSVNGKRTRVSGAAATAGFLVNKGETEEVLPDCVMSFAYWNPSFLNQERLLNPQTGEFLDVVVESLGNDKLMVRGQSVAAQRFKITARGIDLLVWYSANDEWLALESVAKGGRVVRYELS